MLNIPEAIKTLFERDDIHKNFRVHFPNGEFSDITNENIVEESVKFTESFCSQNNFRFGLAESSVLEFETVGAGNMFGMTIDASMEIDTSMLSAAELDEIEAGNYDGELIRAAASDLGFGLYRIPYGRFFVESCPRNHQAMAHRNVVAYSVAQIEKYNWGDNPAATMSFDIATLRDVFEGDTEGFTEVGLYEQTGRTYLIAQSNLSTTGSMLYLGQATGQSSAIVPGMRHKVFRYIAPDTETDKYNEEYVVDIKYESDAAIDDMGKNFMAELIAIAPNGYPYTSTGDNYGNTSKAINNSLHLFETAYYVYYSIYDKSRPDYAIRSGRTLPKPIPKPGRYPVSLSNELDAVTGKKITLGANEYLRNLWIYIQVPYFVVGEEKAKIEEDIYRSGGLEVKTHYPAKWPLATDHYRPNWENMTVYAKRINKTGIPISYKSEIKSERPGLQDYYNYSEVADAEIFVNADFELTGNFGKIERTTGKFKRASLDASTPVEITPSNYSELWWDEYDIAKIGNVYINSEKLGGAVVSISAGQSFYDMSDNKIISDLAEAQSMPGITELILTSFAPETENCYFTPAELTLHGAPWIEAGDALRITAEDETIVETFALRHTINGIQNITSTIEATSGRIIGVEA